jgi:hypothetical protein
MKPSQVIQSLLHMASKLEASSNPDRSLVKKDLLKIISSISPIKTSGYRNRGCRPGGSINFTIDIERPVDPNDPDSELVSTEVDIEADISDYDPGRIDCAPEDSYPEEGGDVEITSVTVNGEPFELTDDEFENAVSEAGYKFSKQH